MSDIEYSVITSDVIKSILTVINCSVLTVLWNEHTLKGSSKIGGSDFFRHMGCLWQEMGNSHAKKWT